MRRAGIVIGLAMLVGAGCGGGAQEDPEAWPYREVSQPKQPPAGTVLYFHGGGWTGGVEKVKRERYAVRPFVSAGWRVWSVDYRTGRSLQDARRWYSRAADLGGPLCVAGSSSGAHLALMLAAKRSSACAVANGAPTDLDGLPDHSRRLAVEAFGEDRLNELSPLASAASLDAPLLLGHYRDDEVVPIGQARRMRRAVDARLLTLDGPGPKPFVHAFHGVERDDSRSYNRLVRQHLGRAEARR